LNKSSLSGLSPDSLSDEPSPIVIVGGQAGGIPEVTGNVFSLGVLVGNWVVVGVRLGVIALVGADVLVQARMIPSITKVVRVNEALQAVKKRRETANPIIIRMGKSDQRHIIGDLDGCWWLAIIFYLAIEPTLGQFCRNKV
jgi:hypothetical protein